jgi:hypothetical protein
MRLFKRRLSVKNDSLPNKRTVMKRTMLTFTAAAMAFIGLSARADLYTDAENDLHDGTGGGINFAQWPHLNIANVDVTNTTSELVFKIKLAGNPQTVNWGKYCIGIDTNTATGDTGSNGNGWGRKITMAPRGMDFWVGSWVDGTGGAELYGYDGVAWTQLVSGQVSTTSSNVTIRIPFAPLGKVFGDTVDFDVYTTGGGVDPAVDALNNPNVTVKDWSEFYTNNAVSSYTLTVQTAIPHTVKFSVDMGVPIWDFNNLNGNGFDPATDLVFVRGNFNNWGGADQLIRDGTSTIYTNTFTLLIDANSTIEYKFEGFSFPGYEQPFLLNGGNRSLLLTNTSMVAPLVCFGDRCLTDPPVTTVEVKADMSLQRAFGEFNPDAGDTVSARGTFISWDAPGLPLTAGAAPLTNIYGGTHNLYYYPTGTSTFFSYKAKVDPAAGSTPRNQGWEIPISTGNKDRGFTLTSTNPVLSFMFNDETGIFSIDNAQKLDADSVRLTFKAYGEAIYEIFGLATLDATPLSLGSVTNTSKYQGDVSYTNTGLTTVPQQFYRAKLSGFNKPPLP